MLHCGSKIRSKSMSCSFPRYSHFFILRKNPRRPPKVAKIEIFPLCIGYSSTTLWVKNSLEISLSRTVCEIFTLFHFPQKSKMAAKSGENLKILNVAFCKLQAYHLGLNAYLGSPHPTLPTLEKRVLMTVRVLVPIPW